MMVTMHQKVMSVCGLLVAVVTASGQAAVDGETCRLAQNSSRGKETCRLARRDLLEEVYTPLMISETSMAPAELFPEVQKGLAAMLKTACTVVREREPWATQLDEDWREVDLHDLEEKVWCKPEKEYGFAERRNDMEGPVGLGRDDMRRNAWMAGSLEQQVKRWRPVGLQKFRHQ